MDVTATNYNAAATSQTGVTCTYPVVPVVPPPSGGGNGNGNGSGNWGGGGGTIAPTIVLATLPHVGSQPLAYLYLSQIPYTGLDLGPVGTAIYWLVLVIFALALSYLALFGAVPFVNRRARDFGARVVVALNARESSPAPVLSVAPIAAAPAPLSVHQEIHEVPRGYSSYDGFKSFARGGAISIDDIVKGLSRHHAAASIPTPPSARTEPIYENVEPVFEQVESIYENVEPITPDTAASAVPADVRGFTVALVEGDRAGVFAGLRQQVRGSGAPEQLITGAVCLLDDVYRSRIDGSACDADLARMTAKLSTPALEKLVASLTTAIDSSYSTGITGAKLALTRALSVLGA